MADVRLRLFIAQVILNSQQSCLSSKRLAIFFQIKDWVIDFFHG
jgi:hypothetical protein